RAQVFGDFAIRIKDRAKEAAVRAAQLFAEVAEQSQRENRTMLRARRGHRGVEIGVPIEMRPRAIALAAHAIECGAIRLLVDLTAVVHRDESIDARLPGRAKLRNRRAIDSG